MSVNEHGELVVETALGPVKFTKPIAYQDIDGKRVAVAVEYSIQTSDAGWVKRNASNKKDLNGLYTQNGMEDGIDGFASLNPSYSRNSKLTYGFTVASYDKTQDLIIDPLLASTFLGGSINDSGMSLALDTSGNVYVTGYTYSPDFPTTSGAYDTSYNGVSDVFVSKLDGGLTSLLASTYLGGTRDDSGYSLTLDLNGNVYVVGYTNSRNFPTTIGAYYTSYNGKADVFVSKLNSELTSLLASTFLGGSIDDYGWSLALDTSGNVYVKGNTNSTNFPTTSGAYDTSYNGYTDVFVSKLNSGLTSLLASTYLGGSSVDVGRSNTLTLDASGNVYVTGCTYSPDFPTTSGAYDNSYNGDLEVVVSKLDSGLTSLLASTFLGGSYDDSGNSLALDPSGNVYVTGETSSTNFPTTSGAYDTSFNGGSFYGGDVFVSKLDSRLTSLLVRRPGSFDLNIGNT